MIHCITKYHTDVILSRLWDSITQTWFGPNCHRDTVAKLCMIYSMQNVSLSCGLYYIICWLRKWLISWIKENYISESGERFSYKEMFSTQVQLKQRFIVMTSTWHPHHNPTPSFRYTYHFYKETKELKPRINAIHQKPH